jgi:hypothetical protein
VPQIDYGGASSTPALHPVWDRLQPAHVVKQQQRGLFIIWGQRYLLEFKGNVVKWAVDFADSEEQDIVDNVVRALSERKRGS